MATEGKETPPPGTPTSERPRSFFGRNSASHNDTGLEEPEKMDKGRPTKWSMGVLNDPHTHEVPGSVLLLTGDRNEPLGLRNAPARTSHSSLPAQPIPLARRISSSGKKTTKDGAIILEPQPDDHPNDPLNWATSRRDAALISLGLYCMVGGGMTPILAAGFTDVATSYHVTTPQVALTTGLYMMGLGVGSVIASPTAILYGKRPVYLFSSIVFILTSVWCALSPTYTSLVVARVVQGISVSPVECLPSATIAEIFFLHERAYRLGVYTLLLLGGKNLVPLVSAAVIQSLGWRWVFWIVAMVVGLCGGLLFLFVPESFWDRTPVSKSRRISKNPSKPSLFSLKRLASPKSGLQQAVGEGSDTIRKIQSPPESLPKRPALAAHGHSTIRGMQNLHVGFLQEKDEEHLYDVKIDGAANLQDGPTSPLTESGVNPVNVAAARGVSSTDRFGVALHLQDTQFMKYNLLNGEAIPRTPDIRTVNSPWYDDVERKVPDHLLAGNHSSGNAAVAKEGFQAQTARQTAMYTADLREKPRLTFVQHLRPYNGRLHNDKWLKVAFRPFILFCYPAVLWSAVVYSCSIGWLIVISESIAVIFRTKSTYGFSALSTGLVYISPFIGGILGTVVAGKVSDIIVQAMSKKNGGLYEPEFRLVLAIPITITTVIGLMGYGWSAFEHDEWIVPTLFFGIISFGCSLGSTTAITFCVDSYRQYAGEALVTLNFSKNIFHGMVFSLFFNQWLAADGSKTVFVWLGVIQLILMAFSVPMYIFGKRARMWTVRKNLMEKF